MSKLVKKCKMHDSYQIIKKTLCVFATELAENLHAITDLFHQHERSTEDQLLSVTDRAARRCNTKVYVLYLPGRQDQIQLGHWETGHEASW